MLGVTTTDGPSSCAVLPGPTAWTTTTSPSFTNNYGIASHTTVTSLGTTLIMPGLHDGVVCGCGAAGWLEQQQHGGLALQHADGAVVGEEVLEVELQGQFL